MAQGNMARAIIRIDIGVDDGCVSGGGGGGGGGGGVSGGGGGGGAKAWVQGGGGWIDFGRRLLEPASWTEAGDASSISAAAAMSGTGAAERPLSAPRILPRIINQRPL